MEKRKVIDKFMEVQKATFELMVAHEAEDMMIIYLDKLLEQELINRNSYLSLIEINKLMFDMYEK